MSDTTLVGLINGVALNDPLAEFVEESFELDDTDAERVEMMSLSITYEDER